jgi:hypothetical protein
MVTYARGVHVAVPAVCMFLAPCVWLLTYLLVGKQPRITLIWKYLRPFRALILIYAAVSIAAVHEVQQGSVEVYGNPNSNFIQTIQTLYPNRPETHFDLGRDAEAAVIQRPVDSRQIRHHFSIAAQHYERALSQGVKSNENLLYNHALALMRMKADPTQIDEAIANWKRNFPHSTRRSLEERRRRIDDQFENLIRFEETRRNQSTKGLSG